MTACMQRPYQNGVLGHPQRTMLLVRKITFEQIDEMLFQCFWNNIGKTCLNVILMTWDMFLHIFFLTKSTTFLV